MSEMEQLKKNAEEQLANQKLNEISKYLEHLLATGDKTYYWRIRAGRLVDIVFFSYIGLLWLEVWLETPELIRDIANHSWFVILVITIARDFLLNAKHIHAVGEWQGAVKTLEILGILDHRTKRGNPRKKRVWEEGVNMVKSWFEKKKKVQEEVYVPA